MTERTDARGLQEALRKAPEEPLRGTQSFVRVMQWCWRRPSLTGLEVLWRWSFGGIAAWLVGTQARAIYAAATQGTNDPGRLGLGQLTVTDPFGAAAKLVVAAEVLLPPVVGAAAWLVPLLFVLWLGFSTVGRWLVLRRADGALPARLGSVAVLQGMRGLALAVAALLWLGLLRWSSATAITAPLARSAEPRLVLYFAMVVVGTLLLFVLWSVLSWALSLAPLLAMAQDQGVGASLRMAAARGPLRLKLVEINLVMGIVKVALLVLLLVFSACPLPFQSVATPGFLFWWTVGVGLLYLLASDFFHVVRQMAYLELWRAFRT